MNVSIVYASTTGNTQSMAEAVKTAVEGAGATVNFFTADSADKDKVLSGDVILLGSPAMGSEVLEDTVSATEMFEGLKKGALSGIPMGLIHGKMSSQEKAEIMMIIITKIFDFLICNLIFILNTTLFLTLNSIK